MKQHFCPAEQSMIAFEKECNWCGELEKITTQDEIIEMYLQVSKELCNDTEWCWAGVGEPLQMFAKLVAAKAIAELESQEPLGYIASMALNDMRDGIYGEVRVYHEELGGSVPIYTHPPQRTEPVSDDIASILACRDMLDAQPVQRTWVGLTDEEIAQGYETTGHYQTLRPQDKFAVYALARSIEAKLKEKNT